MTVSVILKTLNEEARIGAAIESVLAALDGVGGEVIVADGGSRDRTLAIAARYPIQVVQLEPSIRPSCGIGPQLGFQYSREPFICLMDGDMLLDPGFLPEALSYLSANPRAAGVTGHVEEMNDTSLEYVRRRRRVSPENRIGTIDRMNGGGLYRRAAVEQAGYLSDRNLHGYEEFDLGLAAYMLALAVFLAAIRLERPRSPLLARIGLTSYSMYLFHGVVNALVYRALPLTGEFGDIATMLVCTGLTLALSWLVYRTVERPMISLGRGLSPRSGASLVPSATRVGAFHGRAESTRPLVGSHAGKQDTMLHQSSDYRAVRRGDVPLPGREQGLPPLDIAIGAIPDTHPGGRLAGAMLGTAIAAITLSWFALLGYVGWKIAEAL